MLQDFLIVDHWKLIISGRVPDTYYETSFQNYKYWHYMSTSLTTLSALNIEIHIWIFKLSSKYHNNNIFFAPLDLKYFIFNICWTLWEGFYCLFVSGNIIMEGSLYSINLGYFWIGYVILWSIFMLSVRFYLIAFGELYWTRWLGIIWAGR